MASAASAAPALAAAATGNQRPDHAGHLQHPNSARHSQRPESPGARAGPDAGLPAGGWVRRWGCAGRWGLNPLLGRRGGPEREGLERRLPDTLLSSTAIGRLLPINAVAGRTPYLTAALQDYHLCEVGTWGGAG